MPIANADTDPFPGVAYQAEIPGTRVLLSAADPVCTSGSGMAIVTGGPYVKYCIKTWQPQATIDVEADFRNRQNLAIAQATLESQQYAAANPGLQKCVTWGPVVHANGVSTASGGVCANVVGTKPDGSTQQVAPTQVATTPTTTTPTTTTPTTTTPTTTTPTTTDTSTSTGSATDSRTSTTTSTPVVAAAQNSIALNKVRAIALNKSQQTANLNPGTIWCIPWTFENLLGQECSYQPIQSNNPFGPRAVTVTVPTIIASKTVQPDGTISASTSASTIDTNTSTTPSASDTKTATIVVKTTIDSSTANSGQDFGGTVVQVKQAVTSMVEDTATAKAINTVLQKVSDLSKLTLKSSVKLPTSIGLDISATSNSASICTVSSTKITVKKTGTCKLEYSVTDSNDNTFLITTSIKVKK